MIVAHAEIHVPIVLASLLSAIFGELERVVAVKRKSVPTIVDRSDHGIEPLEDPVDIFTPAVEFHARAPHLLIRAAQCTCRFSPLGDAVCDDPVELLRSKRVIPPHERIGDTRTLGGMVEERVVQHLQSLAAKADLSILVVARSVIRRRLTRCSSSSPEIGSISAPT